MIVLVVVVVVVVVVVEVVVVVVISHSYCHTKSNIIQICYYSTLILNGSSH